MKKFSVEITYNGINLTVSGWYTSYRPGVAYAAPEDCYEPEGGIEEFDILIGEESIIDMLTDNCVAEIEGLAWNLLQVSE